MRLLICAAAAALLSTPAFAQDAPKAEKRNSDYYSMTFIDFKPGHEDEAMAIIDDYFVKAADQAGTATPDMALQMLTGEYDMLVIWKMKGGVADMEWARSPDDVKWMAAMSELAGGPEAGQAKWKEYLSHVQSSKTLLAHQAK